MQTPISYAAKLATYITDPSTIRARTIDYFGRAPSIDQIANLRAEAEAERERFRQAAEVRATPDCGKEPPAFFPCGHENAMGNIAHQGNRETCLTCLRARRAENTRRWQNRNSERREASVKAVIEAKPSPWQYQISASRRILYRAAELFDVPVAKIVSPERKQHIVRARWAIMLAIKRRGGSHATASTIAPMLGLGDHTTVLYGLRMAGELAERDADFAAKVADLIAAGNQPPIALPASLVGKFTKGQAA